MTWHLDVVEAAVQPVADPVVTMFPAVLHEARCQTASASHCGCTPYCPGSGTINCLLHDTLSDRMATIMLHFAAVRHEKLASCMPAHAPWHAEAARH